MNNCKRLRFQSFEELQTRLILLPMIEEEGVGAVVASLLPTQNATNHPQHKEEEEETDDGNSSLQDITICSSSHDEIDPRGGEDATAWQGSVLLCMEGEEQCKLGDDWRSAEFADILATIRQAATPITLRFIMATTAEQATSSSHNHMDSVVKEEKEYQHSPERMETVDFEEEKKMDALDDHHQKQPQPQEQQEQQQQNDTKETNEGEESSQAANSSATTLSGATAVEASSAALTPKFSLGDFSSWTSRVKATSVQLAAGAASSAASLATAAKERANASSSSFSTPINLSSPRRMEGDNTADVVKDRPQAGLYIQTSVGTCLPLPTDGMKTPFSSELKLTNSSLLLVRLSPTEPCPLPEYTFQWYRSPAKEDDHGADNNSLGGSSSSSSRCSNSSSSHHSGGRGGDDDECGDSWTLLEGATNAAFQPSATEVGYRLRCIVQRQDCFDHADMDDDEPERTILESNEIVTASLPIFNGSRQALVRGAQFGGLIGRGKAEGRFFRIKVQMIYSRKRRGGTAVASSALTIFQVCGKTAEPIHSEEQPLVGVTAVSDYSNAKAFQLVFPKGIPPSAEMVAALTDDNNHFALEAPNRLARESLLLTLGIANYQGTPASLDASTVLFRNIDSSINDMSICEKSIGSDSTDQSSHASSRCSGSETSSLPLSPASSRGSSPPLTPESIPRFTTTISTRPPLMPDPLSSRSRLSTRHKRSRSVDSPNTRATSALEVATRTKFIENEMALLRTKLERKSRVVSELQRRLAQAESECSSAEKKIKGYETEIKRKDTEKQSIQQSLRIAEKRTVTHEDTIRRLKSDFKAKETSLQGQVASQAEKISELEKTVRTLQNEKAVLSAAVEARETKLSKMSDLQSAFDQLSIKAEGEAAVRAELAEANNRCKELTQDLQKARDLDQARLKDIAEVKKQVADLSERLKAEEAKTLSHASKLDTQQIKIQKLIAERNSYKQKGDSLTKEIGRVCRGGRTIRDVEKTLADDASRKEEVELLRDQKRKALEELEFYRTAFEQSRMAQKLAGLDLDSAKIFERNAELERLLSELTEYVNAKEMQLETYKQVNDALQTEIRDLAKVNMNRNEI